MRPTTKTRLEVEEPAAIYTDSVARLYEATVAGAIGRGRTFPELTPARAQFGQMLEQARTAVGVVCASYGHDVAADRDLTVRCLRCGLTITPPTPTTEGTA
jgi:hypothetical protein